MYYHLWWNKDVYKAICIAEHRLPDTSTTRHFGIKTLWNTSAPISRHFDTKNVVRDTSTRVPWSRKSRDTSTQDSSDETRLHRWFVLNFGTNFVMPKCLVAEVSGSPNIPGICTPGIDSNLKRNSRVFRCNSTAFLSRFGSRSGRQQGWIHRCDNTENWTAARLRRRFTAVVLRTNQSTNRSAGRWKAHVARKIAVHDV